MKSGSTHLIFNYSLLPEFTVGTPTAQIHSMCGYQDKAFAIAKEGVIGNHFSLYYSHIAAKF